MYIHIYMRWRDIRNDGRPLPAPPTRARNDMFCMMAYIRTWDHYQDISVCLSVCLFVCSTTRGITRAVDLRS